MFQGLDSCSSTCGERKEPKKTNYRLLKRTGIPASKQIKKLLHNSAVFCTPQAEYQQQQLWMGADTTASCSTPCQGDPSRSRPSTATAAGHPGWGVWERRGSLPLGTNQGVLMELNKRLSPCQLTPALTPWGHVPSAPPGAPPVGPGSLVFALLWHSFGA